MGDEFDPRGNFPLPADPSYAGTVLAVLGLALWSGGWDRLCGNCGHSWHEHYWPESAQRRIRELANGERTVGRAGHPSQKMEEGWCHADRYEYRPQCDCRAWVEPGSVRRLDVTFWPDRGTLDIHSHADRDGNTRAREMVSTFEQREKLRHALEPFCEPAAVLGEG